MVGGGSLGRGSVVSWPLPPLTWEEAAGWAGGFPACYRRFCMVGKDHPIPTPPIPTTTPTRNPSSWGRPPPPPPPKTIQSNLTPFPQCTQRTLQVGRAPRGHPIQPLIQLCPLVAIKADETSEITHPLVELFRLEGASTTSSCQPTAALCPLTRGIAQLGGALQVQPAPSPPHRSPTIRPSVPTSGLSKVGKAPEVTQPLCTAPHSPPPPFLQVL